MLNQQDYYYKSIRSSAVLTNSYVASTVLGVTNDNIDPGLRNQLVIYFDLTLGNLTSATFKVEFSHDGTTFYQETFSSLSGGTDTVSAGEHVINSSFKGKLPVPIKDRFIKISAKGTGDVTNSLLALNTIIGIA